MSMILNVAKYFFRAMTGSYALSLILFLLSHFLIGERWVVIAFFNSIAQLIILPSLLLFPICLLFRQWRLAAAFIPSILFFAFTWGQLFIPNDAVQAESEGQNLSIMSFNMGALGQDPALIVDVIRANDADIVALQELGIVSADAISTELSVLYPYMALHPQRNTTRGQGIISRVPITEDSYWQYDFLRSPLGHQRVYFEELSLVLYNLHPTHPGMNGYLFNPSFRSQEIADILERSQQETGAVILVGDFNMPDLSEDYAKIRQSYQDAFFEVGSGFGWTFTMTNSPAFLRLDYLFYRGGLDAISATVLENRAGSDHHPILVEIRLTPD